MLIAYILALVLFAALDITWLTTFGAKLYKEPLGDILLSDLRMAPVAAFYLMFPAGLVFFVVAPAMRSGSLGTAALYGALFGLFTYGTYELTNYATIRNWTLQITVVDLIYGMVASALVGTLTTAFTPAIANMFGAR
jgi:uncharacterized membrane protein